jgi:hypothetical protein
MIDWKNLGHLPYRRTKSGLDRERLAEVRHTRQRAQHKGRNHLSNQKRRQIALEHERERQKKISIKDAAFRKYKDRVRAYWQGTLTNHPNFPNGS